MYRHGHCRSLFGISAPHEAGLEHISAAGNVHPSINDAREKVVAYKLLITDIQSHSDVSVTSLQVAPGHGDATSLF